MSNQFLNSESIFEVIGNYPVVDQFDVLYTNLQSGSYVDNYITGAMFTATRSSGSVDLSVITLSAGNRGVVFSKLGVDQIKKPGSISLRISYDLQPWRERAGTVKNIKIFSNSERFYDSLLPNINEYIEVLGGKVIYSRANDYVQIVIGQPPPAQLKTGQMVGFNQYFPFESLFSSVNKIKNIDALVSIYEDTVGDFSNIVEIKPVLSDKLIIVEWNGLGTIAGTTFWLGSPDSVVPIEKSDAAKILFGFGDRSTTYVDPSQVDGKATGSLGLCAKRSDAPYGPYYFLSTGPVIRGWKYGLHDGAPHYTSCVFRRDRFGQHRDMLEQRLYPVSYLDYENAPTRFFGDFETSATPNPRPEKVKNVTIEYPLTVTFVKQQVVTLGTSDSPTEFLVSVENKFRNETWSSNLSSYATSSLPYFDLENSSLGRNRDEIPNSVINPEAVYTMV